MVKFKVSEWVCLYCDAQVLILPSFLVPIPTYFFLSASPLHPRIRAIIIENSNGNAEEPLQVAKNVYFLDKVGVFKLPNGLRVAIAGGLYDASRYNSYSDHESGNLSEVRLSSQHIYDVFLLTLHLHRVLTILSLLLRR